MDKFVTVYIHDRFYYPIIFSFNRSTCFIDSLQADTSFLQTHLGCDSIIVTNKTYKPLDFISQTKDISCFGKNDGSIQVFPDTQFLAPFKIYLNDVEINQTILSLLPKEFKIRIKINKVFVCREKFFFPNQFLTVNWPDLKLKNQRTFNLCKFKQKGHRMGMATI